MNSDLPAGAEKRFADARYRPAPPVASVPEEPNDAFRALRDTVQEHPGSSWARRTWSTAS
jgi:hypothetical protein